MDAPQPDPDRPQSWHALSPAAALTALGSTDYGLSETEAARRLARFGPNRLPEARTTPLWRVFARQFKSPLIYVLLAAAGVSLAIGAADEAGFIVAVLLINAVIGTAQEWRAEQSARALQRYIEPRATVRRGGQPHQVLASALVPGDVVRVEAGGQVPADLRLLQALELQLDESLLTGESTAVPKQADVPLPADTGFADRANMLHAGTIVLTGRALAVVTATGTNTVIGGIAAALAAAPPMVPPLLHRLAGFGRAVGLIIAVVVAVLALIYALHGAPLVQIFFMAVALAVGAIPEGLPVAITVALAIASARMAGRNVVVRLLPAVEGLGSCTLIASDKTGTLTRNELMVRQVVLPDAGSLEVTGEGYRPVGHVRTQDGGVPSEAQWLALRRLVECGLLCNEASYQPHNGDVEHLGDTVDVALQALAAKIGLWRDDLLRDRPERAAIPFEPARRFAATVHGMDDGLLACVKGAAETVLPMCTHELDRAAILAKVDRLAGAGFRVLALAAGAVTDLAALHRDGPRRLEFLGLVALIDPLRAEVPAAVASCRDAGIAVCMVTGDHPATALAIARDLGLATRPDQVMTGVELAALPDDADLMEMDKRVFARVEPVQKTEIVRRLQAGGEIVAVTGDGVNDAPALHAADIGVAMGRAGTDVARGAAELILTDDNFASLVAGVEEGRVAYDNVRKVVFLLISTGAGELVLFALSILVGLPLPLFPVQLLWLNLVSNGIQDVALAFEKGEPGVLTRPPRPPGERIFDRRMIGLVAMSGGFMGAAAFVVFASCLQVGLDEFEARNVLLLLMVSFENVQVFNCRSETLSAFRVPFRNNPFVVLAALAAQGLHIAAMHLPGLSGVLQVAPVDVRTWLSVVAAALSLLVVMEIYKWLRPRLAVREREQ